MLKFPDEITFDTFKRWLWRLAILGVVSPVLAAVQATLFFQDRVFALAGGTIFFVVGLMLIRASYRLEANPQQAFLLIERAFYLTAATMLMSDIYSFWSTPELFNSVLGVLIVLITILITVIALLWLREVIIRTKNFAVESHRIN